MEPLFFVPFFEGKSWGGKRLSELYKKYPADIDIGESWELSPVLYRQTFVKDGEYAGMMLSDLYSEHRELFGTKEEQFPFVIKLIDARENLPLQVNGGDLSSWKIQSQGWYIIKADPSSKLVVGANLKDGYELFNSIVNESLEDVLIFQDASEGDSFFIPPGYLHAIGSGILIYEISNPGIETSTIYDKGKYNTAHIDKILDKFVFDEGITKVEPRSLGKGKEMILDSECFKVQRIDAAKAQHEETRGHFTAYTAFSPGIIKYEAGSKRYRAGDTFIVPAGFGAYILEGGVLLKAYI